MEETGIIPVKIIVMEYTGNEKAKVHVAMTTNEIKKSRVKVTPENRDGSQSVATSIYKMNLSQLLGLVNDETLSKYIPQCYRDESKEPEGKMNIPTGFMTR